MRTCLSCGLVINDLNNLKTRQQKCPKCKNKNASTVTFYVCPRCGNNVKKKTN